MSSIIWTPRAVSTSSRVQSARLWRAVEAQHRASTRRLVGNVTEQHLLEDILEATKPPVADDAGKLDYLLSTPFRYPPRQGGSRFRGQEDPGVFYGAEEQRTACAELGYWRWRFLTDSEGLTSLGPAPQTLFQVAVKTSAVDLEKPPFSRHSRLWRARDDYRATQRFGRVAREAGAGLIRYQSVRDPAKGQCGAVLRADAFSSPKPVAPVETWFLTLTPEYVTWQRDSASFEFAMQPRAA